MDIQSNSALNSKTSLEKRSTLATALPIDLTTEQIVGLAPDKYHIRTSRTLAVPEKWKQLGRTGNTIWGIVPIQAKPSLFVWANLEQLALTCSCKSRKHPCSHLLGLLLLFVETSGSFVESEIPGAYQSIVKVYNQKRKPGGKAAKKGTPKAKPTAEALKRDEMRRGKRRKQNISAGLLELELWLHDMIEGGLAAVQDYPKKYWTNMADRLVDYQVGEIAHHIRAMSFLPGKAINWHDTLLQKVSWLHLLIQGFKRFDDLSLEMQSDLRVAVGWMPRIDEAVAMGQDQEWDKVEDSWIVVGKQMALRGKQTIQRTWLWGEHSNRAALLLDVVQHRPILSPIHIVGTTMDATLHFAPSTMPLYAQIGSNQKLAGLDEKGTSTISRKQSNRFVAGFESIGAAMDQHRTSVTMNPWLRYFPVALNGVTVERVNDQWGICDTLLPAQPATKEKDASAQVAYLLPLPDKFGQLWHMQSLSHLQPLSLFGEWDGDVFTPQSIWYDNRLIECRVLGGNV